MKKIFLAAVFAVCSAVSAMAIDAGSLGVNFLYGSKFDQVGLGVNYKLSITDNIRVAPEAQYFFSSKSWKTFDFNANVEYVSTLFDDLRFYPLVGFTYSHWTSSVPAGSGKYVETCNRFGVNVGGGLEYNFNPQIGAVFEVRGQLIKDFTQCVMSLGVKYHF